jgi:hypothetical protein
MNQDQIEILTVVGLSIFGSGLILGLLALAAL